MNTNGSRPKMDLSGLEAAIEQLHNLVGDPDSDGIFGTDHMELLEAVVKYLEYFSEKTENNRLYHKKQNVKKRLAEQMLKKMLSADELKSLDEQAAAEIGDIRNPNSDAD